MTDTEAAAALRSRVAAERGLNPALVERLRGTTEEELTADADALLAIFPSDTGIQRAPLSHGSDVTGSVSTLSAGAARYAARKAKANGMCSS